MGIKLSWNKSELCRNKDICQQPSFLLRMMAIPIENDGYKQRETVKLKRRKKKMTTVKTGEGCFQELDSILS